MKKTKIFQKILKDLRIKKGLTQEQIAAKAFLNAKYYNRIELGKSIPTITTFFKICKALKIKPEKFMHLIDNYNISTKIKSRQ